MRVVMTRSDSMVGPVNHHLKGDIVGIRTNRIAIRIAAV